MQATIRQLSGSPAVAIALVLVLAASCTKGDPPTQMVSTTDPADSIYFGGTILTMDDRMPEVEAIAVRQGTIVARGDRAEIESEYGGDETRSIDLAGRTMMPGFIDSHSHLFLTGLKQATVNMDPPPAGDVTSIPDIQDAFAERLGTRSPDDPTWLIGWGYDNAMLAEGRHPTRDDLDAVSRDVPIMLFHFSTHMIVVNSEALSAAGITAESSPPEGGVFRKDESGELNGIVEETALQPFLEAAARAVGDAAAELSERHLHPEPPTAPAEMLAGLVEEALETYVAEGFTTVSEMGASRGALSVIEGIAAAGRLPVDVVAAPTYLDASASDLADLWSAKYTNRFRVAGGKINLDGGTPGRTAYLREPYFKQLPGEDGYRGYSSIERQEDVNRLIGSYYETGVPVFIHALGDAALDMAIVAIEVAEENNPGNDRRTQLIHLQQVQPDQFDALSDLDVSLTFQITHNFYFADFHAAETLGPERTARLNPARSAIDGGQSVTIHHDAPIHPVDQFTLIWAAVNRLSRSGQVWGPDERISVNEALKASTINAAFQFKEDDVKGSIEVGKLADLIILDMDPTQIDPALLKDVQVLETIKEDRSIFTAE